MTQQRDLVTPVTAIDHSLGPQHAPVTVVEYGDFECPTCKQAAPSLQLLLSRFPEQVRIVFRHFPLEEIHPHALCAAEASEVAAAQGRFWEMHDLMYERQDRLQLGDLLRYAAELGLDVGAFEADLSGARFGDRVAGDVVGAEAAGVAGTPTFFINDRRYVGAYDEDSLEQALREALREAQGRRPPPAATPTRVA